MALKKERPGRRRGARDGRPARNRVHPDREAELNEPRLADPEDEDDWEPGWDPLIRRNEHQ